MTYFIRWTVITRGWLHINFFKEITIEKNFINVYLEKIPFSYNNELMLVKQLKKRSSHNQFHILGYNLEL